ncbi:MAG: HAD family phosphatase [Oscillospiraceae bacterium]|nr:HAD family phosphatase [Oscillospiraceae bacterium]
MKQVPKLIAFDLDGTLLDDRKGLSERNRRALLAAAEAGAWLVPATGRIPAGLPEPLRGMKGMRWGILCNGAELYDFETQRIVGREEIPLELALELLDFAESLGLSYDCYQDNWGYMTEAMHRAASEHIKDKGILDLVLRLRTPVPELRAYLREKGETLQKLQFYFTDMALRARLLRELPEKYPTLAVTTSLPMNIEINSAAANKGRALLSLCALLGIDPAETMAFGDGSNDISLLRAAGCGVATANAFDEVKAAADRVAPSNNESGVAAVLEEYFSA